MQDYGKHNSENTEKEQYHPFLKLTNLTIKFATTTNF